MNQYRSGMLDIAPALDRTGYSGLTIHVFLNSDMPYFSLQDISAAWEDLGVQDAASRAPSKDTVYFGSSEYVSLFGLSTLIELLRIPDGQKMELEKHIFKEITDFY